MNENEIITNLWIGNRNTAKNDTFLNMYKIELIVNATKDIPFINETGRIKNVRIPVDDHPNDSETLYKFLDVIADTIHRYLNADKAVLVHCHAGIQRSATIVASYLMKYGGLMADDAIKAIKSKRKVCFTPSANFRYQLIQYQHTL